MNNQLLAGMAAVPAITGIVQIIKQIGLPDRAAPLVSLLIGIAAGMLQASSVNAPWSQGIVTGVGFGLAAAGLYHGTIATANKPSKSPTTVSTPPSSQVSRVASRRSKPAPQNMASGDGPDPQHSNTIALATAADDAKRPIWDDR